MMAPEGFQCEACGRFFVTPEDLRSHDTAIHATPRTPLCLCSSCGGSFDSLFQLEDHRANVHSGS